MDAVINLASFPGDDSSLNFAVNYGMICTGSATSMHQTDYAWSHGALSDKKRDSLVALYPERRSKRPNSLVEYSDGVRNAMRRLTVLTVRVDSAASIALACTIVACMLTTTVRTSKKFGLGLLHRGVEGFQQG